ncbi:hypothetical protein A500_04551 [Clostridium sartagoforme AAU1]|uniref:Uncharacterized protein n=1 Tax=Clostridium sartagoforme AAU1 TaxID=1202534 RepID=R9CDQ4_9CLOT|nr:hypothetical protein [Clostridium sartagoforme]EOR27383.1 hypothetical protein A500_04551 [Clostridium sartagoforme AAU1]
MIEGYSEYVIDALLNLDYDIAELNGVSNYFTDLINKEVTLRSFFERSVENHIKYREGMHYSINKIRLRLEIDDEVAQLHNLNKILKEFHADWFVSYSEELKVDFLNEYATLCKDYIEDLDKMRTWLITFGKIKR